MLPLGKQNPCVKGRASYRPYSNKDFIWFITLLFLETFTDASR